MKARSLERAFSFAEMKGRPLRVQVAAIAAAGLYPPASGAIECSTWWMPIEFFITTKMQVLDIRLICRNVRLWCGI